jgi:hypothetical protein
MKGFSQKLTRKQELAIVALMTQPTIEAAAAASGIANVTMWRWMRLPEFQQQYQIARRRIIENALGSLQQATSLAVETLVRNLSCGQPGTEVRAAQEILNQSVKALELFELESRLESLEKILSPKGFTHAA